jgi:hypothetical protein
MTKQEWLRLKPYVRWHHNTQWKPRPTNTGRRHIKGRAKAVGQVLKHSSIKHEVHIETIFRQPRIEPRTK